MPQFGAVARSACIAAELLALAAYATSPRIFGDASWAQDWPMRLRPWTAVFPWFCLAALRLIVVLVLWSTRLAALLSKRCLRVWAAFNCFAVSALCGVVVVWRYVGYISIGSTAAVLAACFCQFFAVWCYVGSIDLLQAEARGPNGERELFLLGSLEAQARSLGVHPDQLLAYIRGGDDPSRSRRRRTESEASAALLSPESRAAAENNNTQSDFFPAREALNRFTRRAESIRSFWSTQLAYEAERARQMVVGLGQQRRNIPQQELQSSENHRRVFALLLRLFAHEDVLEELKAVLLDDSRVLNFHSLQLATFVLFGAFWDGPSLRELLLDLCKNDARFAHRVEWYLRAFASGDQTPELRLTEQGEVAVARLREDVRSAGEAPCRAWRSLGWCTEEVDDTNAFDEAPKLVDALTEVSRVLCDVPLEQRGGKLREHLEKINELLPSRAAYVPLGFERKRHRVIAIHAAESKVFSTKDRCPYLACIEVVDLDDDDEDYIEEQEEPRPRAISSSEEEEPPLGQWSARRGSKGSPVVLESFFSAAGSSLRSSMSRGSSPRPLSPMRSPPPTPPRGALAALAAASGVSSYQLSDLNGHEEEQDDLEAPGYGAIVDDDAPPAPPPLTASSRSWEDDEEEDEEAPAAATVRRGKKGSRVLAPRAPRAPPTPDSGPPLATPQREHRPQGGMPPPTVVFREPWAVKEGRIRLGVSRGSERGWRLVPVIVKACDDLRQEQFAAQLFAQASAILAETGLPVSLRAYDVVATSADCGLIEAIPDTVSLDALRKNDPTYTTLLDFFERQFAGFDKLAAARANFVESLAPACIMSYILQLKDRHNGNILLGSQGHVSHIDFGFMLLSSPGGNMGFEAAPFKLTNEFLEVIGADFWRFKELCVRTFLALRLQRHRLVLLAEMTVSGCDHLPCFAGRPREAIDAIQRRFKPKLSDRQCRAFVHRLIDKATNHWSTGLYDEYQRRCVGIF